MRAVVIHAPHDLRVDTIEVGAPGPGEVRVRLEAGGICGSDLHYYHQGGFGTVRIQAPMILGHEVAGRIEALGAGVTGLRTGERVALSPSRPCGTCRFCRRGEQNHCLDMRFYGSAMRVPHIEGAFREAIVADAAQCHGVPDTLSAGEAAMAEPLAVALHAAKRAGDLLGARVLVTGAGPIGALCALVARRAGAAEVVVTDVVPEPLGIVARLAADRTLDVATEPEALRPYAAGKGRFDVLFEASGNARALVGALECVRPRGTLLQVGLGGEMTLPINTIVAKELALIGTFRFHEEYALAVEMLAKGLLDVRPLVTATLPLAEARAAFDLASDRRRSMKVQLALG
jgi:L-idonate 5-dehydrogenase